MTRILITTTLGLTLVATVSGQSETAKQQPSKTEKKASSETLETPFGTAKSDRKVESKPVRKSGRLRPDLQVEKDGDKFKFSKKSPFGVSAWTRSEAELSEEERAVLEERGLLVPAAADAVEANAAAKQP